MAKDTFVNKKIAIIGGGHMGMALADGLLRSGKIHNSQLSISDPSLLKIVRLKRHRVNVTTDNAAAISHADIIFLAVKPTAMKELMREVRDQIRNKLVVSVAAAISMQNLKKYIHAKQKIARIMPNIPVTYNHGVIGLFVGDYITTRDKAELVRLLSSLGHVVEVEKERDLDTLTLLSACGPAIISSFMEMMSDYAGQRGIAKKAIPNIVNETFLGTLQYLNQSSTSPPELMSSVATKGGVTEAILKKLAGKRFKGMFVQAMEDGRGRIEALSQKLNK